MGLYYGPEAREWALCPFHCKPRQAGVSWESPLLESILQVPGERAEVDQNHDARNAVSATVSVLKWSVAIFRLTSSKVSVEKVLLCPFHCKPRPSGVSLESPGRENILQVPGNCAEVDENYDAPNVLSAILSILNLSRAIFRPWSSKVSVQKVLVWAFHCKPKLSKVR